MAAQTDKQREKKHILYHLFVKNDIYCDLIQ